MSCSCRFVSWRKFARGLAQIHRSDNVSSAAPLRWPARQLVMLGQNRGLHASGPRRQEAAAAAAVEDKRHGEGDSRNTNAEDGRTSTTEALDEVVADANAQPAERIRAKRDGKKKTSAATDGKDDSRNTTSRGKRERKAKLSSAEGNPPDSAGQPPKPGPRTQEPWKLHKAALKEKFPEGWQPRKRLSPDALAGIRALNAQFPDVYTTAALADKFQVSSEAIRRILKSNWRPSVDEEEERQQRWFRRGKQVWEQKAALGIKPPQRWRMEGIARDPGYHEWSKRASQREREWEKEEESKYRAYLERMKKKKAEGKGRH
ncbi:Required for respiratory growth protein 9 [Trichoderma ghanense]|uniref:Required for respiratory growth protein 9, mitochondrial n=1 Tax=Trichoderma ghanense TaxID=65468 RepID=A0ABY2GRY9_9HYPO